MMKKSLARISICTERVSETDKWAVPVPVEAFPSIADRWQTLHDFLRYVNVSDPPEFRRSLFT